MLIYNIMFLWKNKKKISQNYHQILLHNKSYGSSLTHCILNRLSHTIYIYWKRPISIYVRLSDSHIPREKWLNYLQTVQTLIRLWPLIWVCTVCHLSFYGSPDYNGLMFLFILLQLFWYWWWWWWYRRQWGQCQEICTVWQVLLIKCLLYIETAVFFFVFFFLFHNESLCFYNCPRIITNYSSLTSPMNLSFIFSLKTKCLNS